MFLRVYSKFKLFFAVEKITHKSKKVQPTRQWSSEKAAAQAILFYQIQSKNFEHTKMQKTINIFAKYRNVEK